MSIMVEANRCLNCRDPQCVRGCPVHTPIPEIIQLLKKGQMDEAGRKLYQNNPLSAVCSIVCAHENQCEGHCVLGVKGTPVHFSEIEKHISTYYISRIDNTPEEINDIKVAVIGAGASGMTAATILAKYGYQVTIFDRMPVMGGMMRYGIPDFRLPGTLLNELAKKLTALPNVKFRPCTSIGTALSMEELYRDGFSGFVLGAGLWQPRSLGIEGESLGNVAFGINYLLAPDSFNTGKRVIVIGVGNSAVDAARTAVRHGAVDVTCYARRDGITANRDEVELARLEGIHFELCHAPKRITEEGVTFVRTEKQADGSFRKLPDSEEFYPADMVIICAGQLSEYNLTSAGESTDMNDHRKLRAGEDGATSLNGVVAAGDMIGGQLTVVNAVAQAKAAAEKLHRDLSRGCVAERI